MKSCSPWLVPTALALSVGCKASVSGEANASTSGEANADLNASASGSGGSDDDVNDFDRPMDPNVDTLASVDEAPADLAPIGARQDLMFKGPGTLSCKCMSVTLGPGNHPAFEWGGAAPRTSPDSQLVIGFSSTTCEGAPEGAKASYWGYETAGDDVVVVVENSHEGRPVTVGAIIPKPMGDGKVYLKPLNARVPYARDAGGRCDLGNPGPKRSAGSTSTPPSRGAGIRIGGSGSAEDEPLP